MKIIDYVVAVAPNTNTLSEVVTSHIRNGWQPFGNIAITKLDGGKVLCAQPMVIYEK